MIQCDYTLINYLVASPAGVTGVARAKENAYILQGQYYLSSEVLRLTGSYLKPDNLDTKAWIVEAGLQHDLIKRTLLWIEYVFANQHFSNFTVNDMKFNLDDSKMHLVSAGIRHDF